VPPIAHRVRTRLRQIAVALQNFHSEHGCLPPTSNPDPSTGLPDGVLLWLALVLPEIEQDALWRTTVQACQADHNPTHNPPHVGNTTPLAIYDCPADGRLSQVLTTPKGEMTAFSSYVGVGGSYTLKGLEPGMFAKSPGIRFTDVSDGTSQTIMLAERPPPDSLQAGRWYTPSTDEPFAGPDGIVCVNQVRSPFDFECAQAGTKFGPGRTDNPCDRYHFWSQHNGGANFAFADGSVRFLGYTIAPQVMTALATYSGGETGIVLD
jgi:prepilin-type processing-associated H-X9-DG protein